MIQGMRRGTPAAELFGDLLATLRTVGTADSMRQVGDKIGAPAATVSQIEKGQRALKEPKIAVWSTALEVDEAHLLELWWLSQGQVLVGDRRIFYTGAQEALGTEPLPAGIVNELRKHPDLEPIWRLAQAIARSLEKALPHATVQLEPLEYEPLYIDETWGGRKLTPAEEDEQADHAAAFKPLPVIECYWDSTPGQSQPRRLSDLSRFLVRVPLLQELAPIVRRRAKSVNKVELEDLIRSLSGPERERVRGYVDGIVEQRHSEA